MGRAIPGLALGSSLGLAVVFRGNRIFRLQTAAGRAIMKGTHVSTRTESFREGNAMATVQDILSRKGRHVNTIDPHASVYAAAVLMNEHKIGSLLVLDGERLVGIFTERDILRRVVAAQRDPSATAVGDVMTADVACCRPDTSVEEARGLMKDLRVRHLPVLDDDGAVVGMLSIGDLNAFQVDDQEQTIHQLQGYIQGSW